MRPDILDRYSSRTILIGIVVLIVAILSIITIALYVTTRDRDDEKKVIPVVKATIDRESTRVYIKRHEKYIKDIDLKTRLNIEKMLYNYSSFVKGNDLYTGVIREGSYFMNKTTDRDYEIKMLVDVIPTELTYNITVVRNKTTQFQLGYFVRCAPKEQQKANSIKCVDEGER